MQPSTYSVIPSPAASPVWQDQSIPCCTCYHTCYSCKTFSQHSKSLAISCEYFHTSVCDEKLHWSGIYACFHTCQVVQQVQKQIHRACNRYSYKNFRNKYSCKKIILHKDGASQFSLCVSRVGPDVLYLFSYMLSYVSRVGPDVLYLFSYMLSYNKGVLIHN